MAVSNQTIFNNLSCIKYALITHLNQKCKSQYRTNDTTTTKNIQPNLFPKIQLYIPPNYHNFYLTPKSIKKQIDLLTIVLLLKTNNNLIDPIKYQMHRLDHSILHIMITPLKMIQITIATQN